MNETIQKKATFLFSPLPLVEEPKDKDEKPKATDLIEFILKQRAGSTSSAPTYKLKVSRFCEGTVSEWISFRKAIAELWKQNGLTNAQDKIANICTILRGDSLTGFEERIQELTTSVDDTGETVTMEITDETVEDGLNAVAHMVFPFRALENQKQWMRRRMKKPKELSIRKYVAAVGRLNNSLPVFPNGKESDKITPGEILEILEWSIPESWRTKFDLDGYVPTDFTKERFMTECEAIERNEPKIHIKTPNSTLSGKTVTHKKSHGVKFRSATQKSDTTAKFYCTKHGHNPSHPTDKCYTLKNRAEKAKGASSSGLTIKSFRKEINTLAKGRPRKKSWKCLPLCFNKSIRNLLQRPLKRLKRLKSLSTSLATAKTKTCLLTKCQSAKRTKPIVRPKNYRTKRTKTGLINPGLKILVRLLMTNDISQ